MFPNFFLKLEKRFHCDLILMLAGMRIFYSEKEVKTFGYFKST